MLALSLSKLILRWVSEKKIVFVSHEVNSQDEHYLSNETEQAPHVNRSYREVKELTEAVFLEASLDRLHEEAMGILMPLFVVQDSAKRR